MKLSSIFRSDRLSPEWTYTAEGTLWRLFCASGGRIVGECRDQDRKVASFFCLDENTGFPLWKNLQLEQAWWVGIEAVLEDTLLFHTYAKPDMPQHRGISAFDVETGALRWRNDDITFWFGGSGRAYAYRDFFEKRVGYELDLKSGNVLKSFEDSLQELHALRKDVAQTQDFTGVVLPEPLDTTATGDEVRSLLMKALRGATPSGSVEFVKEKDVVAFSYYLTTSNSRSDKPAYDNHLCVYRQPGESRLFSGVINENLALPVPDTFFLRGSRLLFLKNQQSLISLRLWQS